MLIKIAFRNILRNRRRSAITLLVIVFGSVGLILFGGYKAHTFYALRESTIRNRLGHLQIYGKGYSTSESQKPLAYALDDVTSLRRSVERDPRVKMTAAQITLMGLVSNGEKSETFIASWWVSWPLRSSGKRARATAHASAAPSRAMIPMRMPSAAASIAGPPSYATTGLG